MREEAMWQRDGCFFSLFFLSLSPPSCFLSCWQAQTFYFGMNQKFSLKTPASGVSNYLTAHPHYKAGPWEPAPSGLAELLARNQGAPPGWCTPTSQLYLHCFHLFLLWAGQYLLSSPKSFNVAKAFSFDIQRTCVSYGGGEKTSYKFISSC